jgi:protein phosphatase
MVGSTTESAMYIYAWATSDVGRKRQHNEDSYLVDADVQLYAVADGMGGENGGEVASDLAVRAIDRHVRAQRATLHAASHARVSAVVVQAIQLANRAIRHAGDLDPTLRRMGTTTTSVLFVGDRAFIGHVGDSRAYLLRAGALQQLSLDHSLVAEQVRAGLITPAQAEKSPYRNVITRSVGVAEAVDVDVSVVDLVDGDTFVLCSDGLSGLVKDHEIDLFLHTVPDKLVDLANERGGHDNITVVVCRVVAHTWCDAGAAVVRTRS